MIGKRHTGESAQAQTRAQAQAPAGVQTQAQAQAQAQAVDPYRLPDPRNSKGSVGGTIAKATFALIAAALIVFACYFAWETLRNPDIDAYADQTIELVGLTDDGSSINVTVSQLSQFHCESKTISGTGMGANGESKAGTVSVYGPELNTVLEYFGYTKSDFRRIKITCKDDYKVTLRGDSLTYDIYLSIASGKNALYEKQQPLRVVIPDEQSGKWGYGVVKIEFIQ